MWLDIYEEFRKLSESEQMALFEAMKHDMFPSEPDKIKKLLKDICESWFSTGLACVNCGSVPVKRNGKYRSQVEQMLILSCQKSSYTTIEMFRRT
ncbi:hypothetical protein J1P26_14805 [Neobacillus sp. MM2021_6]|nr:hypothetical protein [Neobacillus sp. MM2021_6]NHC19120.1 hypothetical protein [Bacillus sp. MM2020_4]